MGLKVAFWPAWLLMPRLKRKRPSVSDQEPTVNDIKMYIKSAGSSEEVSYVDPKYFLKPNHWVSLNLSMDGLITRGNMDVRMCPETN